MKAPIEVHSVFRLNYVYLNKIIFHIKSKILIIIAYICILRLLCICILEMLKSISKFYGFLI